MKDPWKPSRLLKRGRAMQVLWLVVADSGPDGFGFMKMTESEADGS